MAERHDTIVIGGGQAGLAMSYHLQQHKREHVILERGRVAERWRTERWDSLRYQFTNEWMELPGIPYRGAEPNEFAHYSAVTQFIEDYAERIAAPVRQGTEVIKLRLGDGVGFVVETTGGVMTGERIVMATGPFQRAMIPDAGKDLPPAIYQVHASQYRSPAELPGGAVLVVGSGASGAQIAEELQQSGKDVLISVSRHRRVPRRYRGKDVLWWFDRMGRFEVTIDSFPERRYPPSTLVTGVNGGYDMNIRRFARDGGKVLGHLRGCSEGRLSVADDAAQILADADKSYDDFMMAAKTWAAKPEIAAQIGDDDDPHGSIQVKIDSCTSVNLVAHNITAVIWGTGYLFDYKWLDLPVLDSRGAPLQQRGVTAVPGCYFLGLHWMHTFGSGLLSYVGRDAAYIAQHMETAAAH